MAGVVAPRPDGSSVSDVTRVLIGVRRSLVRNASGGSGMLAIGAVLGGGLAAGTLLAGMVTFADPTRWVDVLATLILVWLIGWVMGPIAFRGSGQGLRPEYFALLPIPPRRLAAGLLGASFAGTGAAVTLVAFSALALAGARLGLVPLLVAVPATLLAVVVVVLASKVAIAALTAVLNSRRGQDLGGVLMAVVIALASGGWALAIVVAQQLAAGPPTALSTALRVLPSGWAPVAVAAAYRSDWAVVAGGLGGLTALAGLPLLAWAALLQRNMRRASGQAPRGTRAGASATTSGRAPVWRRLVTGSTGAVVDKELRTWRRDAARSLGVILALLISVFNVGVPAVAFDAPALLPWTGVAAAVSVSIVAVNVYGAEGTALWLTRMIPGVEPADVRGRQVAWLLVVTPVIVVVAVALTALSGQSWAWPWVLAALPAVLGGTAGLMVAGSTFRPIPQKDPQWRTGPFDTSDDPNATGAVVGQSYLMLLSAALLAVPGWTLVFLGARSGRPIMQAAGIAVGVTVGVLVYWLGGRVAARRLADRGAELMDLLQHGPQPSEPAGDTGLADDADAPMSRAASALTSVLWLVGIVCVVPQGLVPIAFGIFGVDQQVKVWFAARYLPVGMQIPAAIGFIAVGLLAISSAVVVQRRASGQSRQ